MRLTPILQSCFIGSTLISAPVFASATDFCSGRYSDAFSVAVCRQDLNKVRVMVEVQGRDVNAADAAGQTPLYVTFHSGSVYWMPVEESMTPMIKYLLAHGANPNLPFGPDRQRTPLFDAAYTGNMVLVPLLVDAGADVNAHDDSGLTAAHEAAFCDFRLNCDDCTVGPGGAANLWRAGAKPVLQYLASKGADLRAKTKDGKSVLASVPTPSCAANAPSCDPAQIGADAWYSGTCRATYLYVRSVVGSQN